MEMEQGFQKEPGKFGRIKIWMQKLVYRNYSM